MTDCGLRAADGRERPEHPRRVRRDVSLDGGRRDAERTREPELPGARAALVVAVDRADGHLLGGVRHARPAADARAAAGRDYGHAGLREDVEVALAPGVALD